MSKKHCLSQRNNGNLFIIITALLLLCGCAALDNSLMETAETLQPGSIQTGLYHTSAINVQNLLQLDDKYFPPNNKDNWKPQSKGITGARVSIGLLDNLELVAKANTGSSQHIALKYVLPSSNSSVSMAIMPSFGMFNARYSYQHSSLMKEVYYVDPDYESYKATGYELPIIFTKRNSPSHAITFATKAAYYPLKYTYHYSAVEDYGTNEHSVSGTNAIYSLGLSLNLHISTRHTFIVPAMGVDYVKVKNGNQGFFFTAGLGYGIQIYPQGLFK